MKVLIDDLAGSNFNFELNIRKIHAISGDANFKLQFQIVIRYFEVCRTGKINYVTLTVEESARLADATKSIGVKGKD